MGNEIWVLCSEDDEVPSRVSLELLGAARELAEAGAGYKVCSVFFDASRELRAVSCEKLYDLTGSTGSADSRGRLLAEAISEYAPEIVLAPSTANCRAICAIAAAICGAGLTADCTSLGLRSDGLLDALRPAMGGELLASILCPVARPQMATVRPGVYAPYIAEAPSCERVTYRCACPFHGAETVDRDQQHGRVNLSESRIIVAGGIGVGSRENFGLVEALATKLGGEWAASRGAVNSGFAPYSRQVGLSGVSVHPDVYIALGISGAIQHLAGIRLAKTIIAVNNDPNAPIFRYADISITADWRDYAERLMRAV